MTKFVFGFIKLHLTSPSKCYVTKHGCQTSPTFHQAPVFQMLGEMFDQFDWDFKLANVHCFMKISTLVHIETVNFIHYIKERHLP